jgi:hypothetical protein
LAVYNQNADHSGDEQFSAPFRTARDHNTLLPLRQLTENFSPNPRVASLSYGESYSAVKFMIEKLGADKFARLLQIFREGAAYDDALQEVYGVNMDGLENLWRRDMGATPRDVASVPTPTPGAVPTFEISSPLTADATVVPTQVAEVAVTPASNPDVPAPAPLPANQLCGGSLAVGVVIGASLFLKRKVTR